MTAGAVSARAVDFEYFWTKQANLARTLGFWVNGPDEDINGVGCPTLYVCNDFQTVARFG